MSKKEWDQWVLEQGLPEVQRSAAIPVETKSKSECNGDLDDFRKERHHGSTAKEDKPYYKIIDMGHVIQIYKMEKAPFTGDKWNRDRQDEDEILSYLGISGDEEETKERNKKAMEERIKAREDREAERWDLDRQKERRDQTVRDAKNNLKRQALMNFTEEDVFITLTYEENMQDVDQGDKDLKAFVRKLRKETGQKFKYIAVREFQKRGALHFHMMADLKIHKDNLHNKKIRESYERWLADLWGKGFVDIMRMDKHKSRQARFKGKPIDNVGAYLGKYFAKSAEDPRLQGHKIYLPSKGIAKPKEYKGEDADQWFADFKSILDEKKIVFSNEYESEYLGQIQFTEFNLKRDN